jgi:hypothetical protein
MDTMHETPFKSGKILEQQIQTMLEKVLKDEQEEEIDQSNVSIFTNPITNDMDDMSSLMYDEQRRDKKSLTYNYKFMMNSNFTKERKKNTPEKSIIQTKRNDKKSKTQCYNFGMPGNYQIFTSNSDKSANYFMNNDYSHDSRERISNSGLSFFAPNIK